LLTSWTVLACWDSCFCSTFLDPSYLGLSLYRHEPDQLAGLQYLCSTNLWIWSFKSRLWMLKNLSKNNMGSTIWSKSYCMMVARWGHLSCEEISKMGPSICSSSSLSMELLHWKSPTAAACCLILHWSNKSQLGNWFHLVPAFDDLFSCRHPLLHRFVLSSNRNFPPHFYK